jgi:fused signal recognition particle receptor
MMKWFKRGKKGLKDEQPQSPEPGLESDLERAQDIAESEAMREYPIEPEQNEAAIEEEAADTAPLSAEPIPELQMTEEQERGRFFRRLKERMHRTREHLVQRVDRLVLGKKTIDLSLLDELEEILITSDLGVHTTQVLLDRVTERVKRKELTEPEKLHDRLRIEIQDFLAIPAPPWSPGSHLPWVIIVVGVNGVGKTTTIGKLAYQLKKEGREVLLVAGDTFRAAAGEQLALWGERVGVPVIRQKSGSDPSAVAFDAMEAALSRGVDVVLVDTAGRMHTKVNLMEELKKLQRVIKKKMDTAPHEVLLVLDATTGQNALSQARLFKSELGVTGLILTKLDGTAKGGIVVAICRELQLPLRFIGIGEGLEDLQPFVAEEFVRAIF